MANPTPTLFAAAQKQIYNLMKFDSFSRFLKSDLYKEATEAEMQGKPLPFADKLDPDIMLDPESQEKQQHHGKVEKTASAPAGGSKGGKKSSSSEDVGRRRSLLPWGKDRSKSKERPSAEAKKAASESNTKIKDAGIHGVEESKKAEENNSSGCTLARVILPDKATTVVQTRSGETIRAMVSRLLEKRGLRLTSFDVFATTEGGDPGGGQGRPLDLSDDCSTLGCTEVRVEPRVLFRLELPTGKSIGVKAKPAKVVRDVLGPILRQYGWDLGAVVVRRDGGSGSVSGVDLESTVASIDNCRLSVRESGFRGRARSTSAVAEGGDSRSVGSNSSTGSLAERRVRIFFLFRLILHIYVFPDSSASILRLTTRNSRCLLPPWFPSGGFPRPNTSSSSRTPTTSSEASAASWATLPSLRSCTRASRWPSGGD